MTTGEKMDTRTGSRTSNGLSPYTVNAATPLSVTNDTVDLNYDKNLLFVDPTGNLSLTDNARTITNLLAGAGITQSINTGTETSTWSVNTDNTTLNINNITNAVEVVPGGFIDNSTIVLNGSAKLAGNYTGSSGVTVAGNVISGTTNVANLAAAAPVPGNMLQFDEIGNLTSVTPASVRADLGLGALAQQSTLDYTSAELTNKPTLGALAAQSSIDYTSAQLTNKPALGALAALGVGTGLASDSTNLNVSVDYTSAAITNKPTLGALAAESSIDYTSGQLTNKPTLGTLAAQNTVDYATQITNLPTLGALASESSIDYTSGQLTNKPTLGTLAAQNTVDYATQITNLPALGALASESSIDYTSGQLTNKPTLGAVSSLGAGTGLSSDGTNLNVSPVQTQITQVGTLTSLGVTGDITGGGKLSGDVLNINDTTLAATVQNTIKGNVGDDLVALQNTDAAGFSSLQVLDSSGTKQMSVGFGNSGVGAPYTSQPFLYANNSFLMDTPSFKTSGNETVQGNLTVDGTATVGGQALGALAFQSTVDYTSAELTNKPTLGALAALGAGTGLTSDGTNLNVNANQPQITGVGTLNKLTVTAPAGNAVLTLDPPAEVQPTAIVIAGPSAATSGVGAIQFQNASSSSNWGVYHAGSAGTGTLANGDLGYYNFTAGTYPFVLKADGSTVAVKALTVNGSPVTANGLGAGTGLTSDGTNLNVNASQPQITSVGTLTSLTSDGQVSITKDEPTPYSGAPLAIVHTGAAGSNNNYSHPISSTKATMGAGECVSYYIGQSSTKNNGAYFGYVYESDQSATNYATIGLFGGSDQLLKIYGDGHAEFTGNVTVDGSLTLSGSLSAPLPSFFNYDKSMSLVATQGNYGTSGFSHVSSPILYISPTVSFSGLSCTFVFSGYNSAGGSQVYGVYITSKDNTSLTALLVEHTVHFNAGINFTHTMTCTIDRATLAGNWGGFPSGLHFWIDGTILLNGSPSDEQFTVQIVAF